MTMDGGWGLIIATVVGVVLVWIGNLTVKHFDNSEDKADSAGDRVNALEKEFLKYQAHVAENYQKIETANRMEEKIFGVLARVEAKVDDLRNERSQHHG